MPETIPVLGVARLADASESAEVVVRNARVFTNDPRRPEATCLAIQKGRITLVGGEADVAPVIGAATRVIDARGRRVIPGLNDSHLHVIRGALNYLLELRWDGVPSLALALSMLREQVARTPAGQWVRVVGGWSADQFVERRLPTLSELNAAAPDTPVFVLHLYQLALLNRAALKAVGYTKDSPNPPGGEIVRGHNGEPTGLLLAAPAAGLLYATLDKAPHLSADEQVESTRYFFRELNRFGLTSAIDAGGGYQSFPENYAAVMSLAKARQMTLRVSYHLFPQVAGQELADLQRFTEMVKPNEGDEWLRVNGAGENLAWSPADFENFTEPRPQLEAKAPGELEAAVRLLLDKGWGFRLHATYGETIASDLEVFSKIAGDGGFPRGVRWFFDHAETVSDESLERIAHLGGAVSIQNRMMFQGRAFVERYGAALAQTAPPLVKMLERGLTVGAGTDATRVSSYNPWLSLEWLVRGRDIGGLLLTPPANRVDRETAMTLYTSGGAALTGEADVKGRLKEGYYADLVILSDDFFSVPEEDISHIESVLTIVGGDVVYAAGPFEGLAPELAPTSVRWSPVAVFGGFHATREPSGWRQAQDVLDVASSSNEQRTWRTSKEGVAPATSAEQC
ncbi:MAG TPA: amidohydrolase [Acidimicrobiales bacterium]|nr:amidohydrolase [Acidimicrobiales bacterium]